MAEATWNYPTRIVFGTGAVSDIGSEAKALGVTRALIVSDAGVSRAGLLAPIEKALKEKGIESARFEGIVGGEHP
jgi:alcohol dehydrogenase class IV